MEADTHGGDETLGLLLEASRTAEGRSLLAAQSTVPSLLRRLCSPQPPSLLPCLRLIRNLCAGEIASQTAFVRFDGPDALASVILGSGAQVDAARVGAQVLANVVAAGEEHKSAVWGRFFPEGFGELARVRDLGACDALCMVLYQCCCLEVGDQSEDGRRRRLRELCEVGPGLGVVIEVIMSIFSVDFNGDQLHLLLSRVCFEGPSFYQLFSALNYSSTRESDAWTRESHFTSEQAFLVSILAESLSEQLYRGIISSDFSSFIFKTLKDSSVVVDFSSRGTAALPTGFPDIDILGFSLTLLRDICALDHLSKKIANDPVELLISSGLCQFLLGLLRDLEPPSTIRKSSTGGGNLTVTVHTTESAKVCPYKGYRRDLVAVIGNCLFRRKHVQDEIRKQKGILLLLQQCVTDDNNPYLREWGVWAARCLFEGNLENQQEVSQLELQGPVDTPEISKLGLKVEIDPKSQRPKLVNVSHSEDNGDGTA